MAEAASSGHEKAAAFLLSLERDAAARVLKAIDPEVLPKVARAMIELAPDLAKPGVADELWTSVAKSLNRPRPLRPVDESGLEALMTATLGGPRAKELCARIQSRRDNERPFHALERYSGAEIASVLLAESSPCVALVLSHIDPALSGEVIRRMERERALDVIKRMATLQMPERQTLRAVADGLIEALKARESEPPTRGSSDRLKGIAELLGYSPPELEKGVLEAIADADADMANELREYLFTWEDIANIDKRSMQKILGTVDTKTLSVALKACTPAIEQNVLGNLSTRVRDMVAEERDLAGAVPMSVVKGARDEIMKNIRAMIEAGEFSPSRKGEDLVT